MIERIAANDQLLLTLLLPEQSEEALNQSLGMIDRSMEEMAAGKGEIMQDALQEIAEKYQLKIDR